MSPSALYLLLCTLPLAAAERAVQLDTARTAISFTLADVLHTVHGTFKLKRGSITIDSATGKASGEIVVDVASGNSGNGGRDKRMHKEILESMRFPEAIFTADRVTGELATHGESDLDVHGAFQIHGASHEMTLHFRAAVNGSEVVSSTAFTIPYVQWGMKNPSNFLLRVSDKVEMNIQATGRLR
ncbi:MAG: YceI family protein [Acidobacteriota bacterium]